ncbi:sigma-70 family RNA polymerase sigma factor [Mucilaginibacter sp. BJC16-A38]|uniref:RNA polymerase sigma factor n=1 Tax=Mucilaginibacter phenanthrenivorans TaxID=1234842 RepID=UPI0021582298|nr:sigma-70 family RNA polymerase sigma factor [Mucilaginibacter phenanthrenivorans]MCR8560676.1 sigma-70 family RNA polymerase sigma factor [Mucilaginibacter phenanthrenivorans]
MISSNVFSDQELITLLQEGDHAAFTEIYTRYWEKMVLIAWNHTRDKCAAEDIVHEVFISLWKEKNNLQILNVGGFLATKIKFAVFKNYRKEQRRTKLAEMNFDFNDVSLDEEKLDALFLQEYINGIVEDLPEKCRLVFKYSRQLGMKNADIASQMNISEKGVEANLTRALKIIRNNLETTGILLVISNELLKFYKL